MMHLRYIGQLEAYLEEEHAGQRHTITAILPREKVEELYRRLTACEWRPISEAPEDETAWLWVFAPGVQDLSDIYCVCRWHPDAGFCVDELRSPTMFIRLSAIPRPPKEPNP